MALIGEIRKHAGVAIGFVAISMGAFVLGGDLLSGNSQLFSDDKGVGEIAGVKIEYNDFSAKLKEQEEIFRINRGTSPSENDQTQMQEQIWNQYIYDIAFINEVNELGIQVHDEELFDLVQGEHVHPQLAQQFKDESGKYNKNQLIQYLQFIGSPYDANRMPMPEADFLRMKNQFIKFEQGLPLTRKIEKYNNLLSKSIYVTKIEAKDKFVSDNESVTAKFLYVPYMSILDSTVEVSDSELKTYLSANSTKYQKKEATRSIEYVVFQIKASKEDSLVSLDELQNLKADFETSENDSLFSKAKSDNFINPVFSSLGNVPKLIQDAYPSIDTGMVYGPILEGNAYKMYKISAITEDTVYSARASHILFKSASQSDEDLAIALADANKVLNEIKNGADFAEMAAIHGTDGTKNTGGDLGWFAEGRMVAEFNDAVMAKSTEGLLPRPIKTNFGYHIIKVTGAKTNANYKISIVDREIMAGEDTRDIAYRKADVFAGENTSESEFNEAIEADPTLFKANSENLKPQDRFLQGAGNARRAVQWAFNEETVLGEVSDVFDLEDGYLVALLNNASYKGNSSVEDVREELTVKVRNDKKATTIMTALNGANGSLTEKQTAYGSDASVLDANNITLNTPSVPGVGFDPIITGSFLATKEGEASKAIKGENGVVVIEVTSTTPSTMKEDYTSEKSMLLNQISGRIAGYSFEAIKKAASIEDNRVKYY